MLGKRRGCKMKDFELKYKIVSENSIIVDNEVYKESKKTKELKICDGHSARFSYGLSQTYITTVKNVKNLLLSEGNIKKYYELAGLKEPNERNMNFAKRNKFQESSNPRCSEKIRTCNNCDAEFVSKNGLRTCPNCKRNFKKNGLYDIGLDSVHNRIV
jgi:hypothetical protein